MFARQIPVFGWQPKIQLSKANFYPFSPSRIPVSRKSGMN
jgi:hypothetical protein